MIFRNFRIALTLGLAACLQPGLASETSMPLLHPLFSDHAILQRDQPLPVWGWAESGSPIGVRFGKVSAETVVNREGQWRCELPPQAASAEGRSLTVSNHKTGKSISIRDVMVGDVWLCSGQSNMEMGLGRCNEEEEMAAADFPSIRLLNVDRVPGFAPARTLDVSWHHCSPESIREGAGDGFSAAAYFFGKKLHQDLGIPIGLIHSSWGGTEIESWISGPALKGFPSFQRMLAEVTELANSTAENPELAYLDDWYQRNDPGTRKNWHVPDADASSWRSVTLPGTWTDCGIPGFEGVVWARREIDLPEAWAELPLVVKPGEIADNDTCWLNGQRIGGMNMFGIPRTYKVPAGIARAGRNVLTLRITNCGGGSITQDKQPMGIHPVGQPEQAIPLAGSWKLRETSKMADTGRPLIGNPNVPGVLFNGMIAPLRPFAMTGVIWYQGEANAERPRQYRKLLLTLIRDWRTQFQREDLAFHIVSLANYGERHEQPSDDNWAELREAQAMTAKSLPDCELAVTIDIGEANDIHPKNKREVGRRLALAALAGTYGRDIVGSGPWFREARLEGNRIRLHFDHADGGLTLKGDSSRSFAIAGKDRKFAWAKATIDGETVILSSPDVPEPAVVRYAWDADPQAPLYNAAELPAVPFRTEE